ncbi:thiol reductant ABC exporter subunit CydD [Kroppenstedtia pulmonis]|uniref:Thiol reductant ABC exporter subunit CydD n=1 Tax=Kroppenstedtia pulmonis TaxID=1380685 RepID=A0A7D3XHI8_9BACL|nr:thiol reductant ABC exporter subunit CydD [Kroppenstedtia pulmonis]QKG83239.1 thiol reductant ABC exporter subunit CydD [Kroppenstedtia pulmonis]
MQPWRNLQGVKLVLLKLSSLVFIQSMSILLAAKWLADAISALFAGAPLSQQWGKLGLFLTFFLLRHVTGSLQQKMAYRFAEKAGTDTRRRLMDRLFLSGPGLVETEGTGKLVTLALEGVSQFRKYVELFLPRMIGTTITPAVLLFYIFMLDTASGVILVVTMPILIVFLILIGLAARKQTEAQLESYRMLSNHFVDSLRGLETLKFLGQSRAHGGTIGAVSGQYRAATMRTLRIAFLSSFALDFFTMLSVASVAVSLGLRLIDGQMELVTGLTVLILAPEFFLPVRMVGADYHATLNGKEAGEAIQSIIQGEEENKASTKTLPPVSWSAQSSLSLSSVGLRYEPNAPPSLEDVSLSIQGFGKIGIVGESGAGKSTLIDVLAGFRSPTSGKVELDGIELESLVDETWRKQTTYIPQHPYLFNLSLADNIRFYQPDASREEVKQAVDAVGLSSTVEGLPSGLDEWVGNGGHQLSGGQEQRVALARAWLGARSVLLLDEPTAHLDVETEYELKEIMLRLFENKRVFLATHRLHWMPHMDQIIVLDKGRVVETGTHEQLLAQEGRYKQMIMAQGEVIR